MRSPNLKQNAEPTDEYFVSCVERNREKALRQYQILTVAEKVYALRDKHLILQARRSEETSNVENNESNELVPLWNEMTRSYEAYREASIDSPDKISAVKRQYAAYAKLLRNIFVGNHDFQAHLEGVLSANRDAANRVKGDDGIKNIIAGMTEGIISGIDEVDKAWAIQLRGKYAIV